MLCSSCGCEMRIVSSAITVTGDNSPDDPTRVVRVQTLKCVNKSCPNPAEQTVEHDLDFNHG